MKKIDISSSDKEWITPKIKILIKQRQRAHVTKNYDLRKHLNKKIQQEIWKAKLNYNKKKAHLFHATNPREWYRHVNKIIGNKKT